MSQQDYGDFADLVPQKGDDFGDFADLVPKPTSAIRKVADLGAGFASGAIGATKAVADAAGAGNAVSGVLDSADKKVQGWLSPQAVADQQEQQAILREADGKGILEGIKAGGKAFMVAPVQTAVQGLGSVVPTIAAAALTRGASVPASLTAMGGIGAAQGAGSVKGGIYDDIKQRSAQAGIDPAIAEANALKAQEYGGPNTAQIALGGVLGAADALTGVDKIAGSMLRKKGAEELVKGSERGIVGRAIEGAVGEMPLEAAQGGQQQYATNVASQREGFAVDPMDGVVSQGVFEGLASAGPGAAFGAAHKAKPAGMLEQAVGTVTPPSTAEVASGEAPPITPGAPAAPTGESPNSSGEAPPSAPPTEPIPVVGPLSAAAATVAPQATDATPFPFSDKTAAQKQADARTREAGQPFEVADHPTVPDRFAVLPAKLEEPKAGKPDADGVVAAPAVAPSEAGIPVSAATGPFATIEQADDYISTQKRAGSQVSGLPVPMADGTFGLATKGTHEYETALTLREMRAQQPDLFSTKEKPTDAPAEKAAPAQAQQAAPQGQEQAAAAVPAAVAVNPATVAQGLGVVESSPAFDGTGATSRQADTALLGDRSPQESERTQPLAVAATAPAAGLQAAPVAASQAVASAQGNPSASPVEAPTVPTPEGTINAPQAQSQAAPTEIAAVPQSSSPAVEAVAQGSGAAGVSGAGADGNNALTAAEDVIGRDGLRQQDRYLRSLDSAASELSVQVIENSRDEDFDPKELPQIISDWAKQSNVAADDLRAAFTKRLADSGLTAKPRQAILNAIDPTRAKPVEATPESPTFTNRFAAAKYARDNGITALPVEVPGKGFVLETKPVQPGLQRMQEAREGKPPKSVGPATVQAALDAWNSDDSGTAMAVVGKLKSEDLKDLGRQLGFYMNHGEGVKAYRDRIATIADRLKKTNREQAARERALFDQVNDLARDYNRMKEHADRATGFGAAPDSTAFQTFLDGKEMHINEALPKLVERLQALQGQDDYKTVAPMVQKARPEIFGALALKAPATPAQPGLQKMQQAKVAREEAARGKTSTVATPKDVVGESRGGRSAGDETKGDTVTLFHGSPEASLGGVDDRARSLFGGVFASSTERSAQSHGDHVYSAKIPKSAILTQHDLEYEISAERVEAELRKAMRWIDDGDYEAAYKAVIEDRANSIDSDELTRIFREDDAGEAGWAAQRIRGQVARALGYKAVEMSDEHGTSYMLLPGVALKKANESTAPTSDGATQTKETDKGSMLYSKAPSLNAAGRENLNGFARFGQGAGDAELARRQVAGLIGAEFGFKVEMTDTLDDRTSGALRRDDGVILINQKMGMNQAALVEVLTEETLHAVDSLNGSRLISASSPRLLPGGDIYNEAVAAERAGGEIGNFLIYPMQSGLAHSRTAAELFARLGTVYYSDPQKMQREMPVAYEVYDELFGLEQTPGDAFTLRARAWRESEPASALRGQHGARPEVLQRLANRIDGKQAHPGLGKLRAAVVRNLSATPGGAFYRGGLSNPDTGRTIQVNGKRRPIENSKGQLIASGFPAQVAFHKWFGDSKVVDGEGRPLVMFHGTTNLDQILESGFKKGWTHLTDSKVVADSYQEWARGDSAGTLALYVKAENPAYFDAEGKKYTDIGNKIFSASYDAEKAGHDALIIKNIRDNYDSSVKTDPHTTVVAFSPSQIKSATGNAGTFDPSSPSILESRTTPITDTLKSVTVTDVTRQFKGKLTDLRPLALQTLGGRQIADIYGKDLPQIDEYTSMVQQMSADANEVGANADKLALDWAKVKDEKQLAELMHDATIGQIDPSKEFVPGDNQKNYNALKLRYAGLSAEAKAVFNQGRDAYEEHYSQVREAIRDRIQRAELSSEAKADMLARMDGEFFEKIRGVYFPLARFGKYVVIARDGMGKAVSVSRAESMAEAQQLQASLKKDFGPNHTVSAVMKDKEFNAARDGVGREFLKGLFSVLDKSGVGEQLQDAVNQLYLNSMPDLSWTKHGIHRKGTPGFSQQARRAYAQSMFHGARYLAKLRYADQLQKSLDDMQEYVKGRAESTDSVRAQQVIDELVKRHDSLMNPKGNPLSTALTSFGFIFHLGLSPASALVNLSQTALVAYPIMGAKWGFDKAAGALALAGKQAMSSKNDMGKMLQGDEKRAYDQAVKEGTIDVTMAHDLAGIAQGEDQGVMWKMRPVMRWASFLFHHAERFNRQVTFIAAYRLAKATGAEHGLAVEQATKATYDGHFDYAASNRPRVMQGNVAKVVLLFKQYSQNMIYTLGRAAQQSIAAETPQRRAEARKTLAGLLVMHASAAGVLGLPMVSTMLAIASGLGGSDDEPWDAEVALKNMLADAFGQKPAEVLAHGLSRLTPADISRRVGLDNLIFPDIQEGLEGTRLAEAWMAGLLGPVAGIATSALKGMQDIGDGNWERGLESMMPSVLRAPLKAYRYATEGAKDKTGVVIKDDVSPQAVAAQTLGFAPSEVQLATEGRRAIYSADKKLMDRRADLMEQAAKAIMSKDAEGLAEAREAIAGFNQANPNRRIAPLQIQQSVRQRSKRIAQAEQGVYLPRNRRDVTTQGRFATEE